MDTKKQARTEALKDIQKSKKKPRTRRTIGDAAGALINAGWKQLEAVQAYAMGVYTAYSAELFDFFTNGNTISVRQKKKDRIIATIGVR